VQVKGIDKQVLDMPVAGSADTWQTRHACADDHTRCITATMLCCMQDRAQHGPWKQNQPPHSRARVPASHFSTSVRSRP